MNTANEESAGGSQSSAVGQGALLAARTRNAGAPAAAIEKASRTAGEDLSRRALQTRISNAQLKESQRRSGLGGLESLYDTETGAGLTASGQIAPDVNANTNAANQSWDWARFILDPALQAGGAAAAAKLGG